MQIRIGNKQDEPACRNLSREFAGEAKLPFDLESTDSDLKNIESEYLGHDGIFLVAEEDQDILAFAAAARGYSEDVCELRRLCVAVPSRRKGLGKKLVEQVVFFARNLDYKQLRLEIAVEETEGGQLQSADLFLLLMGFSPTVEQPAAGGKAAVYEMSL